LFRDCYIDDEWVGCYGRYDHSDRWLLIFGIIISIVAIYKIGKKLMNRDKE